VISGDGRYVVFYSFAKNLIDGTTLTGNLSHVYVRDLQASTIEMVDVSTAGTIGDALGGDIDGQDISEDGRFVVFQSNATNIDSAGNFGTTKVFVRDRTLGTTTVLSKSSGGTVSGARYPSMSCDGAFVSFTSASSSLTSGDTNGRDDVFLVQRVGGNYITNLTQAGILDTGISKVSCNGNYIGITTKAALDAADTDTQNDNYVYDRLKNSFERVNISSSESTASTAADLASTVTVSDDGRYAVFLSTATNLDSIATSGYAQIYMRDRTAGATEIVSKNSTPTEGDNDSGTNNTFRSGPEISPSGKYVVYGTKATNLVSPDINIQPDIFLAPTGN
jgi:dipeptidyl aminopeptidase/acylaminoacyl peptidase